MMTLTKLDPIFITTVEQTFARHHTRAYIDISRIAADPDTRSTAGAAEARPGPTSPSRVGRPPRAEWRARLSGGDPHRHPQTYRRPSRPVAPGRSHVWRMRSRLRSRSARITGRRRRPDRAITAYESTPARVNRTPPQPPAPLSSGMTRPRPPPLGVPPHPTPQYSTEREHYTGALTNRITVMRLHVWLRSDSPHAAIHRNPIRGATEGPGGRLIVTSCSRELACIGASRRCRPRLSSQSR